MKEIYKIPVETWFDILRYTDVVTISKIACLNKNFNNLVYYNLWSIIDNLYKWSDSILIPNTLETYIKYRYLVDWSRILLYNEGNSKCIPENVILWIPDNRDLEMICVYQNFSENIIRQIYKKLNTLSLLSKQKVPVDILFEIVHSQNEFFQLTNTEWYHIWSKQDLTFDFVLNNLNKVQWNPLSGNKSIVSVDFIRYFSNDIIWQEFTRHGIHEEILESYIEKFDLICWNNISRYTELSNRFIIDNIVNLEFDLLIRYQTLSEEIINIILEKSYGDIEYDIYMQNVAVYQKISKAFIRKHRNIITKRMLIKNDKIPRTYIHEIYGDDMFEY